MFCLKVADDIELGLLEPRHAAALTELVDLNREDLGRFLPWARHQTREDTDTFIGASLQKFARGDGFEAAIMVGGEMAGMLGLHAIQRPIGATELGYWLAPAHRGRGVMTSAIEGLLPLLFGAYQLNRVEIRCDPDNHASRRVAERLGFRHEGTLRAVNPRGDGVAGDAMVFGLLRDEWASRAGNHRGRTSTRTRAMAPQDEELKA